MRESLANFLCKVFKVLVLKYKALAIKVRKIKTLEFLVDILDEDNKDDL